MDTRRTFEISPNLAEISDLRQPHMNLGVVNSQEGEKEAG